MIEVIRAPAHLAVQDLGFHGHRNIGLPRSGAMDPTAVQRGNALLGNAPGDAALEWALGGGSVRFTQDVVVAFTGARVHGRLGNGMIRSDLAVSAPAGTVLEIDRFRWGRFFYLCVSPSIAVEPILGSRSTYAPAKLGGYRGGRLRAGDILPLKSGDEKSGAVAPAQINYAAPTIRVSRGPQSDLLEGRLLAHLLQNPFTISTASDRTGYRLDGPAVDVAGLSQILSEPACEGAIQITDGGTPIVLMADGPTIGGYNKIAVALAEDLPVLAQKTPGETVRFTLI